MDWIIPLLCPLLLHMSVSEVSAVFLRGRLDSASVTAVTSVIVIPAAVWMYRKDQKSMKGKEEEALRPDLGIGFACICFLAGGIMNLVWSGLLNLFHIQEVFSNATQESLMASQILVQMVSLGVLVPLAEELIFRGLIYKRMRRFLTAGWAVVFSALLFAVYHGNPIQIIFAFPMAVVLALVLERGRKMRYPVLFHMGANLTAIIVNMF